MREPKPKKVLPLLSEHSPYLSVKETAQLLGVSERCIYGYLESGKLPSQRIGHRIVVRRETLDTYQRPPVGRPRIRTPLWRTPGATNTQSVWSISVPVCPGQDQQLKHKLAEMRLQRKHVIPGTVARYISRKRSPVETIQITLIWRQRELPPEEERQAALVAFRADFTETQVVLNT